MSTERPWSEVTQSILHDPANKDVFGNCLQACVASVMKLPINAVPHFAQFLWWPMALELWVRGHDLTCKGERTATIPERLCIVGGQSPRGVDHVVVGYGGEVVWDPHPSREGLVSIRDATWFEPMGEAGKDCGFMHALHYSTAKSGLTPLYERQWPLDDEPDAADLEGQQP